MANVIKYTTTQPTLQSLRKDNVALGTGVENYGPSSTTGYYSGVEVPDGGFVVYTLGANNSPKAFVASSDEDLPAIARTLGGGELTSLEAKNYLVSLSNTWILDKMPESKVTDGLVLDLNAGNLSSFLNNEPTINYCPPDFANWVLESSDVKRFATGNSYKGQPTYNCRTALGFSWIAINTTISGLRTAAGTGGTVTVSCMVRNNNSTAYPMYAYIGHDFGSTRTIAANSDWQKIQWTVSQSNMNNDYVEFRPYTNTDNVYLEMTMPMVEVNVGQAGSFVSGSRSQNTTAYDLSGVGNNGTLANGTTFDSRGWFDFDGTDDEITVPDDSTLDLTTDMSFEFLFKASSLQNNPYPRLIDKSSWLVHILQTPPFGVYQNVNTSAGLRQTGTTSNIIQADTWTHVISNYDGQIGKIYINGNLVRTQDFGSVLPCTVNGTTVTIGGDTGTSRQLNGSMAKTKIYNRALSESDVKQNYYGGPIVTDGLVFTVDASNLVSYESGSTTTYSMTGSISGSLINGTNFVPDYGGGWNLDGTDDYITFGNQTLVTTDFTIEVWVNLEDIPSKEHYLINIGYSSNGSLLIVLNSSGNGTFSFSPYYRTAAGVTTGYGAGGGYTGVVNQVVLTRSGNTNTGYINGVPTGVTFSESGEATTLTLNLNLQLGWAIPRNKSTAYLQGDIYASKIYNRTLTASEVLQNYNAQKSRFGL